MHQHSLKPKLLTSFGDYKKDQLIQDIVAGVLVGIIAIPLSIALAISSGVRPEMGLYTAIVAGFFISALGGSRVQIGGPTAAFVPIVYAILRDYQLDGLVLATILAGGFLIIMGVCKLGRLIKFIPYPVVTGFTAGIAVSILVKQFKDFLGLTLASAPADFVGMVTAYLKNLDTTHWPTLVVGVVSLLITLFWVRLPWRFVRYVPGSLIAILLCTWVVNHFAVGGVATIGSVYQDIRSGLPPLTIPHIPSFEVLRNLVAPAFSIAILAGIESLLSAVVADGMIGGHHRSNAELVAQGTANIFSAFFGGIPATGAIARTAANVRSGGRTPVAGMVHAMTVLVIMLLLMPMAKMIPLATLAAILIVVAYNMGDWQQFRDIRTAPKSDAIVFLMTFGLTVIFDLVVAIEVGMVLAAFLFIRRMADVTEIRQLTPLDEGDTLSEDELRTRIWATYGDQVLLYEIRGPFFFGAADKLMDTINKIGMHTKLVILKMQEVPTIDATGVHFFNTLWKTCQRHHITLYITHLQPRSKTVLQKAGYIAKWGEATFHPDVASALVHFEKGEENG